MKIKLHSIAYARSGDKGNHGNIGVLAYTKEGYLFLEKMLTEAVVERYFSSFGASGVERFLLPQLLAMNFLLPKALDGGAATSLRIDSQGKSFGQVLLEMPLEIDEHLYFQCVRRES